MQRGKSSRPDTKFAAGGSRASSDCLEESGSGVATSTGYSPSLELLQRSHAVSPVAWPMPHPGAYYMPASMYHGSPMPYNVMPVRPRPPVTPVPTVYPPFPGPAFSAGSLGPNPLKIADEEAASSSISSEGPGSQQKGVSAPGSPNSQSSDSKQPCTFFLRTGTCAYGDKCKFKHPKDRPPPQLNSRGLPVRSEEPDCSHYLKKGWCAFGVTCKFNHPEHAPPISSVAVPFSQPAYVAVPTNVMPMPYYYPYPHFQPTSSGAVPMYQTTSAGYIMPQMQGTAGHTSRVSGQPLSVEAAAQSMQRLRLNSESMAHGKSSSQARE